VVKVVKTQVWTHRIVMKVVRTRVGSSTHLSIHH
jgi:hypothetical protein